MTIKYSIAKEFSKFPGPRYSNLGKHSGQEFRETVLLKLLKENDKVIIDLDGTMGFGSSFLEEAFGGLIREAGFSLADLRQKIILVSDEQPELIEEIMEYIENARE
ncbi:MAG: STAS-like domain-containing protein [Saccharospirillum sp.]|nr:STAS-like domain-containing protein [Saccharospirillum sp.]